MSHNFPPYRENRHQSWLTESYRSDSRLHAVTQHLSDPTVPELSMPNFVAPLAMLKTTANTSLQCLPMEGHGDGTNMAETCMSQDPTTGSGSQRGSALTDDEHFLRTSEEELRNEPHGRMIFIWGVIGRLLYEMKCYDYPRMEELWLRIIEGDDEDNDDLWLWVDGDEEWVREQNICYWIQPDPTDWLNAHSALRRRVTQRRYPPGNARNEKVRNATLHQQIRV